MQKIRDQDKKLSGLLNNGKPDFLAVAKIHKPHGLNGEVSVELLSDFPERLVKGKQLFIGEKRIPIQIETIRKTDKKYLITFVDHDTRDSIESFRNQIVYIQGEGLPVLPENEFYHHDLIGMRVMSLEDQEIGVLVEIIRTGANDVYVIKPHDPDEKEVLIPAIRSVVKKVDIDSNKIVIKLQEWR